MPPSAVYPLAPRVCSLSLLLHEPRTRDHRQLLSQLSKELWTIRNDHNCLLHCTPRDIGWFVQKLIGVHLPSARYAKDGGGGVGTRSFSTEGEVGKIFSGSGSLLSIYFGASWVGMVRMGAVGKGHEWEE